MVVERLEFGKVLVYGGTVVELCVIDVFMVGVCVVGERVFAVVLGVVVISGTVVV